MSWAGDKVEDMQKLARQLWEKRVEKMGIHLSDDELKIPVYNAETMETNVSGLFLAGVVCGGMDTHKWFIENSRVHAEQIVKHIFDIKYLVLSTQIVWQR